MKLVIFAGGSGTRLWPLSRNKFPKQFQPIINGKSSLELRFEQIAPVYGWNNIYLSTTENLVSLVKSMFPQLPTSNIITEPARRDVGPAVGLAMVTLQKLGAGSEPITVLWGDSVTQNGDNFLKLLRIGENRCKENPNQFIWLGEKPAFPNENVGWINLGKEVGEDDGVKYYRPASFKYRPDLETATKWFEEGMHSINTGYFVTTADFIMNKYKSHYPEMYTQLNDIAKDLGTENENETLQKIYPEIEAVHFDHIVLDHISEEEGLVMQESMDWSDPGTLYALKQFLQGEQADNVCKGLVYTHDTKDSLVYNYVNNQVVTTVGLDGFIVVNTPDAVIVCHKDNVTKISDMLKEFKDTELEKYL